MSDLVEQVAKALAKADGLDFDEACGYETDAEECNSGTCVAAHLEDHDPGWARSWYLRHATAALAAIDLDTIRREARAEALEDERRAVVEYARQKSQVHHRIAVDEKEMRKEHIAISAAWRDIAEAIEGKGGQRVGRPSAPPP